MRVNPQVIEMFKDIWSHTKRWQKILFVTELLLAITAVVERRALGISALTPFAQYTIWVFLTLGILHIVWLYVQMYRQLNSQSQD